MNKTIDALKLAEEASNRVIETLEYLKTIGIHPDSLAPAIRAEKKALAAIREARAEQEKQEPVVRAMIAPPAPPEVYQMRSKDAYEAGWWEAQRQKAVSPIAPVFAKREWVDLTDDEIWETVKNWNLKERVEGNYSLTRAVIAKFKEKNK